MNFIHPVAIFFAYLLGGWIAGLCVVAVFVGREQAQAEYRWIEWYGFGQRRNLPWWGSLDHRVWDAHSLGWNLLLPILIYVMLLLSMPPSGGFFIPER